MRQRNLFGSILALFLLCICSWCSSFGLVGAQPGPGMDTPMPPTETLMVPGDPITPTITLTVCFDGANYNFNYITDQDFAVSNGGLRNIDNEYHWGAVMVFYADPAQRIGFSVPASAMIWETPTDAIPFVNHPEWWIQRYSGEYIAVDVDENTPDCNPHPDGTPLPRDTSNLLPVGTRVVGWYDGEERLGTVIGYFDPNSFNPPIAWVTESMGYLVHYDGMDDGSAVNQDRSQIAVI